MRTLTNTAQIRDFSGEPSVVYSNPVTTQVWAPSPPCRPCDCCCDCRYDRHACDCRRERHCLDCVQDCD